MSPRLNIFLCRHHAFTCTELESKYILRYCAQSCRFKTPIAKFWKNVMLKQVFFGWVRSEGSRAMCYRLVVYGSSLGIKNQPNRLSPLKRSCCFVVMNFADTWDFIWADCICQLILSKTNPRRCKVSLNFLNEIRIIFQKYIFHLSLFGSILISLLFHYGLNLYKPYIEVYAVKTVNRTVNN